MQFSAVVASHTEQSFRIKSESKWAVVTVTGMAAHALWPINKMFYCSGKDYHSFNSW